MIREPRGALRLVPDLLGLRDGRSLGRRRAMPSRSPAEVRKTSLALGTLLRLAEDGYRDAWARAGVDVDALMGAYAPTPGEPRRRFAARKGYILLQRDVDFGGRGGGGGAASAGRPWAPG